MITNPIIPIWLITIILLLLFLYIRSKDKKKMIRQLLMIILIFLINLRIMIPGDKAKVMNNNLDVLFVIDTTLSMLAQDQTGYDTRLDAVKADCAYIVNELEGSKYSIITFDNSSKILIPFVRDPDVIFESLDILASPTYYYATGTSLNEPFENIQKVLESSLKKEGRTRIVFIFSDGEITNEEKLISYESLNEYVDDGAVLGYGTENGGYMYVKEPYTEEYKYLEDYSTYPTQNALSKMDEDNLKQVANDLGIEYVYMNKQSNIDEVISKVKKSIQYKFDSNDLDTYQDTYYIFVIPLLILLIYEFISFKKVV